MQRHGGWHCSWIQYSMLDQQDWLEMDLFRNVGEILQRIPKVWLVMVLIDELPQSLVSDGFLFILVNKITCAWQCLACVSTMFIIGHPIFSWKSWSAKGSSMFHFVGYVGQPKAAAIFDQACWLNNTSFAWFGILSQWSTRPCRSHCRGRQAG